MDLGSYTVTVSFADVIFVNRVLRAKRIATTTRVIRAELLSASFALKQKKLDTDTGTFKDPVKLGTKLRRVLAILT